MANITRLRMVGDIMIGRTFNDAFARDADFDPWGNTAEYLAAADLTLGNLETSLAGCAGGSCTPWPDKAFNFRLDPRYAGPLRIFDHLNLANNHVLDFRLPGLVDTLNTLDSLGIAHAGAGLDAVAARSPAISVVERTGLRFHVFGAADHPSEWAAGVPYPPLKGLEGIWWFDLERPDHLLAALQRYRIDHAPEPTDIVIVYLHVGPNWETSVSDAKRRLGHRLIREAGVRVVCGTSAHHLQPFEVVEDRGVIFYSLADFVDDYAVDPRFRNDVGMIATVEFDDSGALFRVDTIRTLIAGMQANLL